jgi:hypothetical protein
MFKRQFTKKGTECKGFYRIADGRRTADGSSAMSPQGESNWSYASQFESHFAAFVADEPSAVQRKKAKE